MKLEINKDALSKLSGYDLRHTIDNLEMLFDEQEGILIQTFFYGNIPWNKNEGILKDIDENIALSTEMNNLIQLLKDEEQRRDNEKHAKWLANVKLEMEI